MRVLVVHAHPVETSYNRALYTATCEALKTAGHVVDGMSLYDENFDAVLSRAERLDYHDYPRNLSASVAPYVERLRAAEAIVFVHPVWNYGYPAILKGFFDRIFLPGVSFTMEDGGDRGTLRPALTNIRKVAYITTYGGNRWRSWLMGDPPRRLARRSGWAMFRGPRPPKYLALYDMNNNTSEQLSAFMDRVKAEMARF